MNITLRFWNDLGYEYMGKTAQNLRGKLGHLEKITKARSTQIRPEIERNITTDRGNKEIKNEWQANKEIKKKPILDESRDKSASN